MCYKGGGAAPNWTSRPGQTTSYQGTSSQIDNITVHKYHNYFFSSNCLGISWIFGLIITGIRLIIYTEYMYDCKYLLKVLFLR